MKTKKLQSTPLLLDQPKLSSFLPSQKLLIYIIIGIPYVYLFIHLSSTSKDCFTIVYTDPKRYSNALESKTVLLADGGLKSSLNSPFEPNKAVYNDESIVFVITPTYTRATQMPDMTRMAQTLRLVPNVMWIVVEDAQKKSRLVEDLLLRSKFPFVHMLGPKPTANHGRGTSNRRKAMEWIRSNYEGTKQRGVIYFADDDNSYDVRVFDEMRDTKGVSMFPVGLITVFGLSAPIVSTKTGKIIGFHDAWYHGRKFAVDMAGFAINLQLFLSKKNATMAYEVGAQEDSILIAMGVEMGDMEPKANNCTDVLVWHSQTVKGDEVNANNMRRVPNYEDTNLPALYFKVKGMT